MAAPLLRLCFVRALMVSYVALMVSYVAFVLSLFVPHLFFYRCLGKAVLRDCGIFWVCPHLFCEPQEATSVLYLYVS